VKIAPDQPQHTLKSLTKFKNVIQFQQYAVLLSERRHKFPLRIYFHYADNTEAEIKEIVLDNNIEIKDCLNQIVDSGVFMEEISKDLAFLERIHAKG